MDERDRQSAGVARFTILFDSVAEMRAAYRLRTAASLRAQRNAEPMVACGSADELEPGAAGTRLFPSGVAAISVALMSVLRPGDELLMVDSTYAPTRSFCDGLLQQYGVATRYYDPLVGRGIADLIGRTPAPSSSKAPAR
jgi:cystathionine beta-lyase